MLALAYLHAVLPPEAKLVGAIHDEIIIEAPDDPQLVKHTARLVVRQMTRAFKDLFPHAPTRGLACPTAGPTWSKDDQYKIWRENGDADEKEPRYDQFLGGG